MTSSDQNQHQYQKQAQENAQDYGQTPLNAESLAGVRILAVHAHPDDESLWTGLALAQWARRGADVSVVTCTLGEEGEVIGEKYQGLVTEHSGLLGGYRIAELQDALAALGVNRDDATGTSRPVFLGGVAHWRDSGMVGTPAANNPRAFVHSGREAVDALAAEYERIRPHVVVTYGPDGGYGHPDHIRAHNISHTAAQLQRRIDGWVPTHIWWCVTEQEQLEAGLAALRAAGDAPDGWRWPLPGELACVPGAKVDARVVGSPEDLSAKTAAMVAHATQLWVANGSVGDVNDSPRCCEHSDRIESGEMSVPLAFCLSNRIAQPLIDTESFILGADLDHDSDLPREILDRLDCLFTERR